MNSRSQKINGGFCKLADTPGKTREGSMEESALNFDLTPQKRKSAFVALAVALALTGVLFLTDMGKELMDSASSMLGVGSAQPDPMATSQTLPPPAPPLPPRKEAPTKEPVNEDAAALARALQLDPASLLEVLPGLQHEPAWKSLDKISDWYALPKSVTKESIYSYLRHDKLWVRLATLQFLAAHPELYAENGDIIQATADQLVRTEHSSQVRRFLKRAESIDLELLSRMKKSLRI